MDSIARDYEVWYRSRFPGRSFVWLHAYGDVTMDCKSGCLYIWAACCALIYSLKGDKSSCLFILTVTLPRATWSLIVRPMQASVLYLFNGLTTSLSFEQIKNSSGIDRDDLLTRVLDSFSHPKLQVLVRTGAGKRSQPGDQFQLNLDFRKRGAVIQVPMPFFEEREAEKGALDVLFYAFTFSSVCCCCCCCCRRRR
jgi:Cullin family